MAFTVIQEMAAGWSDVKNGCKLERHQEMTAGRNITSGRQGLRRCRRKSSSVCRFEWSPPRTSSAANLSRICFRAGSTTNKWDHCNLACVRIVPKLVHDLLPGRINRE